MMFIAMTTDPAIQPPFHIPTLPSTPCFFSLLVCQCLAPGWLAVWLPLFLFWSYFLWLHWCILAVARIEALHAVSHPQLSVSLSLTLNHCTVLCEKRGGNSATFLCWITRLNQQFCLFHFLSPSLGHMSVCVTVLSHIVAVFNALTRRQGL